MALMAKWNDSSAGIVAVPVGSDSRRQTMSEESNVDVDRIPAGECPEHGVIADKLVEWNFPNPARCGKCGAELEVAGMATPEELADFA